MGLAPLGINRDWGENTPMVPATRKMVYRTPCKVRMGGRHQQERYTLLCTQATGATSLLGPACHQTPLEAKEGPWWPALATPCPSTSSA